MVVNEELAKYNCRFFFLKGGKKVLKTVTKRDGRVEQADPEKLARWAKWAAGIGVDWFEIAARAYAKVSDGVSTKELQAALISSAEDLRTSEGLLMAGRLAIGDLYKQVFGSIDNIPLLKVQYHNMIAQGYQQDLGYSDEELDYLETVIDHSKDLVMSLPQVRQDIQKYLISDIVSKQVKETPQFAVMRQAMGACKNEERSVRLERVAALYNMIADSFINTPTPNKQNLGTDKTSYASCCKSAATDTLGSIEAQNHIYWAMTAASAGQGGVLFTRSYGDKIRGGVIKHGGKIPYYRLQQAEVKANLQGARGGALTTYLNALDPEIFTLLALRNPTSVDKKRVDSIDYAFSFNNSFVERAKNNQDWLLISFQKAPDLWMAMYDPDCKRFDALFEKYKSQGQVVKARDLLKRFLKEDSVTGRLYEFNATNVNSHGAFLETIWSSNLCLEYLAPTHWFDNVTQLYATGAAAEGVKGEVAICNLAAISVGKFEMTPENYERVAFHALLMVDNVIDAGTFPLPQVEYTAKARRTAGVGITNLAYAMAKQGFKYSSQEGKDFCHRLAELHTYSLLKASVRLAKEKGKCKWFDKTRYSRGWLPIDTYNKEVDRITQQPLLCDWEGLRAEIAEHGLRNSALVNHMPVESSAVRANDTNGLYAARDGVVIKSSGNTEAVFIPPEWESLKDSYQLAWDVPSEDMADIYAIFQKFADQGISADVYQQFKDGEKKSSLKMLMNDFFYRQKIGLKTRYYRNFKIGAAELEQEEACGAGGCKL